MLKRKPNHPLNLCDYDNIEIFIALQVLKQELLDNTENTMSNDQIIQALSLNNSYLKGKVKRKIYKKFQTKNVQEKFKELLIDIKAKRKTYKQILKNNKEFSSSASTIISPTNHFHPFKNGVLIFDQKNFTTKRLFGYSNNSNIIYFENENDVYSLSSNENFDANVQHIYTATGDEKSDEIELSKNVLKDKTL